MEQSGWFTCANNRIPSRIHLASCPSVASPDTGHFDINGIQLRQSEKGAMCPLLAGSTLLYGLCATATAQTQPQKTQAHQSQGCWLRHSLGSVGLNG
jgi:hypothetical protein